MTARKIAMLVNPTSGQGRGGKNAPVVARRLREHGLQVTELAGGSAEESESLARAALREGAEALIACGGDGTVNLALQAVAGTDIPFGIIPVGTGDDNARGLGIPSDLDKACDVITDGHTRLIDCGKVVSADGNERYFLGVMSIGFDSNVNERANNMSWPSGKAKYLLATMRELGVFKPVKFEMEFDNEPVFEEAMLVAIGNGLFYGGGMKICPDAQQDDGLLDATILGAVNKLKFITSFGDVFKGTHTRHEFVTQQKFEHATIKASGQMVYADGERVGPTPAEINVVKSALNIYVPA